MRGCLAAVVKLSVVGFIVILAMTVLSSSRQAREAVRQQSGPEWYAGGTLHDGTVADWKAASARNRLATAADMAAGYTKKSGNELTMELMRAKAEWIVRNVNVGASDPDSSKLWNSMKLTEMVGTLLLMDQGELNPTFPGGH